MEHGKKTKISQNAIWVAGSSAIELITKGEFNTDPDTITIDKLIQLLREHFMPTGKKYLSQPHRFFWAEHDDDETPEEQWEKLITLEKNCDFKDMKQEDLLISKS